MPTDKTGQFEIPPEMRRYAETTVDQARKAFEDFMASAQKTVSTVDAQSKKAKDGAVDFNEQMLSAAEDNIAAAFRLAQRLVQSTSVQEAMELQAKYLQERMAVMTEQARHVGEATAKAAGDLTAQAMKAANPDRR
ncbi:phasin family protein [Pseudoxanthobacter sp. M-2]|uniref:phasin family protein n=1 Tax=Pseudoxanthobacter sp. M-2 TaxID=3078754 RepID=UPI0038FC70EA